MFSSVIPLMLNLIVSNNSITQEKGMITIVNLLNDSSPSIQKKFFYLNSLQSISKFLENINKETTTLIAIENCVDILEIIINSRVTGKKKAIHESNITSELIKLLSYINNKRIQKKILIIFYSLSISFSIRETFIHNEEIKNIFFTLFESSLNYNDPSDVSIQSNILGIFRNVATIPTSVPVLVSDGKIFNYIIQVLDQQSNEVITSKDYSELIQHLMILISILAEDSQIKQQMLNIPEFQIKIKSFIFNNNINIEAKLQTILALIFLHLPSFVSQSINLYLFIYSNLIS